MRRLKGIGISTLFFLLVVSAARAGELENLKLRVDELEKVQNSSLIKQPFQTFSAQRIHLGGFETLQLASRYGGDTVPQTSFERADFGLWIVADLTERMKLFSFLRFGYVSRLENVNAPWRSNGNAFFESELEDLMVEYRFSDAFSLQGGRIVTPFGIINKERFDPLLLTHDRPQALRDLNEEEFFLFDPDVLGVQALGTGNVGAQQLGYHAYVSTVRSDTHGLGGGGRLFWTLPEDITLGVSEQSGRHNRKTFHAIGTDIKAEYGLFTLRSEYAKGLLQNADDQSMFYVQPSVMLPNRHWILFAQMDYLHDSLGNETVDDDRTSATPPIKDPIKKYEWTVGINYLPWPFVRMRLEEVRHDYRGASSTMNGSTRDYFSTHLSMSVSF